MRSSVRRFLGICLFFVFVLTIFNIQPVPVFAEIIPTFRVAPFWGSIQGENWPTDELVTLTIEDENSNLLYTDTPDDFLVEENSAFGEVFFHVPKMYFTPGNLVTVSSQSHIKETVIELVTFDTIDIEKNEIGGIAPEGRVGSAALNTKLWYDGGGFTTLPDGTWKYSFNGTGLTINYPMIDALVSIYDGDGDSTMAHYEFPSVWVYAYPDQISEYRFYGFTDGAILNYTLYDDINKTNMLESGELTIVGGSDNLVLADVGLAPQAGMYFETFDSEGKFAPFVLPPLELDPMDVENDIISGITDPTSEITVTYFNEFDIPTTIWQMPEPDGTWSVNFADEGVNFTVGFVEVQAFNWYASHGRLVSWLPKENIGVEGGSFESDDGATAVEVPLGALSEPILFTTNDMGSDFTLTTDLGEANPVYGMDIGPAGTTFAVPITITMSWEDTDNDGFVDGTGQDEELLFVSKDGVVQTNLCPLDPGCDPVANTFTLQVSSLSEFVLATMELQYWNSVPAPGGGSCYYGSMQSGQLYRLLPDGSWEPQPRTGCFDPTFTPLGSTSDTYLLVYSFGVLSGTAPRVWAGQSTGFDNDRIFMSVLPGLSKFDPFPVPATEIRNYYFDWADMDTSRFGKYFGVLLIRPEEGQTLPADFVVRPGVHGGSSGAYHDVRIYFNQLPIADAGSDITITGTLANLDGSSSYDPDGDSLDYQWSWATGSATGVNPSIEVPFTTEVTLKVTDPWYWAEDKMTIFVSDTQYWNSVPAPGGGPCYYGSMQSGQLYRLLPDGSWEPQPRTGCFDPTFTPLGSTSDTYLLVYSFGVPRGTTPRVWAGQSTGFDNDRIFMSVLPGLSEFDPFPVPATEIRNYYFDWADMDTSRFGKYFGVLLIRPEEGQTLPADFVVRPGIHGGRAGAYHDIKIHFLNQPPLADANGPYLGQEGSVIALDASASTDPDGDLLTYSWSVNSDLCSFDDSTIINPNLTCIDNGIFNVSLTVSDGMETDNDDAVVSVTNVSPAIGKITINSSLVSVGIPLQANSDFTDSGFADTHTATWDWGDVIEPGIVTQGAGFGSVIGNHEYVEAGVYTIGLTITDDDEGSNLEIFQYVVVYDPEGGFVTGGGWIDSPEGAYTPDPTLTGKATFGFVSKYKKGATVPTGNTEFQFKAGDLNFHSSDYDWLVVTGSNYARFKGSGTINGEGEYKFMIWAGDGTGTDGTDTFRIKIWQEDNDGVESVVYDNGMDQGIGGGSIVVHTGK